MAYSAQKHHQLPTPYGTTAAPPPTPSTQPNPLSSSDTADVLSRLLHRLPPTLALPTRRSTPTTATVSPPLVSLSSENPTLLKDLIAASSQLGFFQLTNHSIPPELVQSAESESLSLFNLPREQKQHNFPKKWPIGFDCDDDEDENGTSDSFCLDSACSTESNELSLSSLREFTVEMEKVGLKIIEALSCAVGFQNPVREDPSRVCSLMWVSEGSSGNKPVTSGKFYPYVVGLEYQIRCQKYSFLADSGWVSASPQVDSILVTLGDIAQVWSNGKIKKVRGRAVPISDGEGGGGGGSSSTTTTNNERCISMSLLVTLPVESIVSPLLVTPKLSASNVDGEEESDNQVKKDDSIGESGSTTDATDTREDVIAFKSFSFEDYAWRVYHERLLFKDPLDRYRI